MFQEDVRWCSKMMSDDVPRLCKMMFLDVDVPRCWCSKMMMFQDDDVPRWWCQMMMSDDDVRWWWWCSKMMMMFQDDDDVVPRWWCCSKMMMLQDDDVRLLLCYCRCSYRFCSLNIFSHSCAVHLLIHILFNVYLLLDIYRWTDILIDRCIDHLFCRGYRRVVNGDDDVAFTNVGQHRGSVRLDRLDHHHLPAFLRHKRVSGGEMGEMREMDFSQSP